MMLKSTAQIAGREVIFASAIKSNGRKNLTEKIKQLFDSQ